MSSHDSYCHIARNNCEYITENEKLRAENADLTKEFLIFQKSAADEYEKRIALESENAALAEQKESQERYSERLDQVTTLLNENAKHCATIQRQAALIEKCRKALAYLTHRTADDGCFIMHSDLRIVEETLAAIEKEINK